MNKNKVKEFNRLLGLREITPSKKKITPAPFAPKPYKWRPFKRSEGNPTRKHPAARFYTGMGVYGWKNNSTPSPEIKYTLIYDETGKAIGLKKC